MGKCLLAALLAGASMPAQALQIVAYIDATETIDYDPGNSSSWGLGVITYSLTGSQSYLTGTSNGPFYISYCPNCLEAKVVSGELRMELRPENFLMGWLALHLRFDQPVAADLSNLNTLTFVSGDFWANTTGRFFPVSSIRGTVLALAAPEPASWAMMIGGFGLAGGAMRRRHQVSFA